MTIRQLYMALRKRVIQIFKGRYFVVTRKNITYIIDIFNYIDRNIEAFGSYEPVQINNFYKEIANLQPNIFLDIGANIGLYSINIARSFPGIKIIAFEPDRRNYCQFHANLFLNRLEDRIQVEPIALSSQSGFSAFRRHDDENRGRSCIDKLGSFQVQLKRLDDVLNLTGERIAIKIDTEGHESDVIEGGKILLMNNDCIIQVESFNLEFLEAQLNDIGYKLVTRIGDDAFFVKNNFPP